MYNSTYSRFNFFSPTFYEFYLLKAILSEHRLHTQIANETLRYQQEICEKYNLLREQELQAKKENLERMKIERELDRQKFVENKQIQQHM